MSEYRADLGRFCAFAAQHHDGEVAVGDIDRDLVRAYQRSVGRARTVRAGVSKPLAPTTRKRRLVCLRSFLRHAAAREGWLPGDLGALISLPKLPERLPSPWRRAIATGSRPCSQPAPFRRSAIGRSSSSCSPPAPGSPKRFASTSPTGLGTG